MARRLTPTLLRKAADLLSPSKQYGRIYMCHAIDAVLFRDTAGYIPYLNSPRMAFERILEKQGVSTNGCLHFKGTSYGWLKRSQEIRFDYLNLLAESLEK